MRERDRERERAWNENYIETKKRSKYAQELRKCELYTELKTIRDR